MVSGSHSGGRVLGGVRVLEGEAPGRAKGTGFQLGSYFLPRRFAAVVGLMLGRLCRAVRGSYSKQKEV